MRLLFIDLSLRTSEFRFTLSSFIVSGFCRSAKLSSCISFSKMYIGSVACKLQFLSLTILSQYQLCLITKLWSNLSESWLRVMLEINVIYSFKLSFLVSASSYCPLNQSYFISFNIVSQSSSQHHLGSCQQNLISIGSRGLPSFILLSKNASDKLAIENAFKKLSFIESSDFALIFYLLLTSLLYIWYSEYNFMTSTRSSFSKVSANLISVNNHEFLPSNI